MSRLKDPDMFVDVVKLAPIGMGGNPIVFEIIATFAKRMAKRLKWNGDLDDAMRADKMKREGQK